MGKTLITGTGRCGTTFLIKLLTMLGLKTGIKNINGSWFMMHYQKPTMHENGFALSVDRDPPQGWEPTGINIDAGLEYHISYGDTVKSLEKLPPIIKNPRFATMLDRLVIEDRIKIDHVIVCVRNLGSVAASKISRGNMKRHYDKTEQDMLEQSAIQLGNLVSTLVTREIPHTFIVFPLMIYDWSYLYNKLKIHFRTINKSEFDIIHSKLADHGSVHFN